MGGEHLQIGPFLVAALFMFALYRRLRRQFGQQPVRPVRLSVNLAMLLALGLLLCPLALASRHLTLTMAGALLLGVGLGTWSGAHTRFERAHGQLHYVPHTSAGIAITALVIARLAYRLAQGPAPAAAGAGSERPALVAALAASPVTLGLLCVLIGYYASYYGRILWKARELGVSEKLTVEPPGH